ncbi:MAG: cache domain-containing protein [Synergistaceae bacterium]|nr:cache domain-containing protein [Synergistaceae bacterium]MBQ3346278.1 cache domain-containing protein [Synergistaceae bacterium]MBQ6417115.1 cache domain-containing protein [Synergistaceae bacterium]MBQ6983182.1 cache domain-containing protein [Synergistaceae bacterium]
MKKISLKTMLIMLALVPLILAVVIISVATSGIMIRNLKQNTKEELIVAAKALKEYYEYDILNDNDLVDGFIRYDTNYIDSMHSTGVDLTLFKGNIRFMTTIKDNNGKRIEGTPASDAVWRAVSAGKDYYSDSVKINGIDYHVYYMPIQYATKIYGMAFSGKPATQIQAAERSIFIAIASISAGLILFFAVATMIIAKRVADPLKEVAERIETLLNVNLAVDMQSESSIYETSQLIIAAEKISEVLNETVRNIQESAFELTDTVKSTAEMAGESSISASQISEAMKSLAKSAVSIAVSVHGISENVEEMGNVTSQAVQNVENLSQNSSSMNTANASARESIDDAVKSSVKAFDAIDIITAKIRETNASIAKISEAVDIISDIASQTNLLSLNASIEAAKAGEAGKGFGVVAGEIKKLAERSDESAEQIRDIVAEVEALSSECVASAEDMKKTIDGERGQLVSAQEKFRELEGEIKASLEEIASVSEITSRLDGIKNTIFEAVNKLAEISEETSATNEEVAASVENIADNVKKVADDTKTMNKLADNLSAAVANFK